jgi:hypothetical protein
MSVLRTCSQQGKDAFASLVRLLRFPGVTLLEIVPTANPPPLAKPSRKRCRATTSGRRSGTAKRFRTVAPRSDVPLDHATLKPESGVGDLCPRIASIP